MASQLEHKVVVADGSGKQVALTDTEKKKMESLPDSERVPYLHQLVSEMPSKIKEAEEFWGLPRVWQKSMTTRLNPLN